jgi:hypothetical protein
VFLAPDLTSLNLFMNPVDDYVTAKYLLQSPKTWRGKGDTLADKPDLLVEFTLPPDFIGDE